MPEPPLIDPRTVLLVSTLMILLNGGVLGLMHRGLAPDMQPSAASWRIATLLLAAACVLQAVQLWLPPLFVLPLANACVLLGVTGYWLSLRQFHGLHGHWAMFLPAALATAGIAAFAQDPDGLGTRIVIASAALATLLFAGAATLLRHGGPEPMTSRRVLVAILAVLGSLMGLRALLTALWPPDAPNLLQLRSLLGASSLLFLATLPVIGTTAFVLMCLERLRGQWQQAASTDYLTGLANRRTVSDAGERMLHAARRHGQGFAIGLLDIDHFKRINDSRGHATGDLALKHLAGLLAGSVRRSDLAGRFGGEEFVLLWDQADAVHAQAAAARLQEQLRAQPLLCDGDAVPMTVSVGIAVLRPEDRQFDDLLRRADQALYAAKAAGRDRIVLAAGP